MGPSEKKTRQPAYIECPFCSGVVKPASGVIKCPECKAVFRFDDRRECFFVDTREMRLPMDGTLCARCGLVQDAGNSTCRYCNAVLCKTVQ